MRRSVRLTVSCKGGFEGGEEERERLKDFVVLRADFVEFGGGAVVWRLKGENVEEFVEWERGGFGSGEASIFGWNCGEFRLP